MAKRVTSDFLVRTIDGGFATQLSEHVGKRVDGDPLWSARFNSTNPDAVVKTHLDFLRSGAEVILTNTYQASVSGFGRYLDLTPEKSLELIRTTVGLAHEALRIYVVERGGSIDPMPWIVGSIGPYGAHLNDGSEYTGDYADRVAPAEIKRFHRERLTAILEAGVDGLAIETIPCRLEAETLVELLKEEYPDVRYWLSFQCNEDGVHLAHGKGETFGEVASQIWDQEKNAGKLLAVGVNCLNPELVTGLLKALNAGRQRSDRIPSVVYPNSGELYSADSGWSGYVTCKSLYEYVPEWIRLNARFIGGCCRTYARDIQIVRKFVGELMVDLAAGRPI